MCYTQGTLSCSNDTLRPAILEDGFGCPVMEEPTAATNCALQATPLHVGRRLSGAPA